jgi:drug/metabolite transporter (DMT)-like permease
MKNIKYILMVLLGGTLYGTMSSFVKLSYAHGFNAAELSFWQAFLAALFLSISMWFSKGNGSGKLRRQDILPLIFTGCAIGLTNFLYYASVQFIPASLAIIILMQFTWLSILLEWLIFRRRSSRIELVTIFFILTGTILAGGILEMKEWIFSFRGTLLAFSSALTYAVYIVANGRIGKEVRWQAKSTIIMVGSSLCIFTINTGVITAGNYLCGEFMLWVLFLAVVGTTIPTALFAAGISKIGAGISSILMSVELPVAILCARIVLHEHISIWQTAGIIIMLASISAMNYYKVTKI